MRIINDNNSLLKVSIALRDSGFMVRRHFNEFFTFDKDGYVGIIIVSLTGDITVYMPTWKKISTETKKRILRAVKSSLNCNKSKIKFVVPKLH